MYFVVGSLLPTESPALLRQAGDIRFPNFPPRFKKQPQHLFEMKENAKFNTNSQIKQRISIFCPKIHP